MYLETGHLYHLYNRGNNSQKIFYNRENYLYFLKKIRQYVLPYARAIQKQEKMTGSLFQEHTKASCLTKPDEKDFNWYYEDYELHNSYVLTKQDYPTVCFRYIHENPVKSALCPSNVDWEFSSAPDYFAKRKGKLINKEKAKEYSLY